MRRPLAVCLLICLALLPWIHRPVFGQELKTEADDDQAPLEQSIYIPYQKLWKVFEKEGRGVFLSYEQFLDLWNAQLDKQPKAIAEKPPVAALVAEVSGTASVGKDVVEFDADVTIEVLKEGWTNIPLFLNDVAVTSASLDGKPARLTFDAAKGYALLIEHQGKESAFHTLKLKFGKSYEKNPGRNSVSFRSPLAPVSRWDVRVPEAGVKVEVFPLLAATDVPGKPDAKETRILAFVGAAPNVRFEWTPKAEGAKGLKALASVKSEQQVTIEEGVTRTRASLSFNISRTELSEFKLEVPDDQKVVNVYDANVREWTVAKADNTQQVTVKLFEPTKGDQKLVVELEMFGDQTLITVPVIKALDVGRQQGVIAVQIGAGLRAEIQDREGLLQFDATHLPKAMNVGKKGFAYRYASVPFNLTLKVEKIQPRITVDSLVEVHVQPEELILEVFSVFDVQRAGVFQLALDLPENYEVRGVRGLKGKGINAAQVDRHFIEEAPDKRPRLIVSLTGKAEGKTGLAVKLRRTLNEPDLLSPTGTSVSIPPGLPRAAGDHIERESGRLVVYGPESLRINPENVQGLRQITYAQAVADMRSTQKQNQERPILSYAYAQDRVMLTLSVDRRAPHVTTRQLLVATVEAGVVKYNARFFYDVLYSGVKSLRIDLPADLVDRVRLTTPRLRQETVEADDGAEGYVAWRISGETEFFGSVVVNLNWEEKLAKLDVGKGVDFNTPRLIPRETDRAWGQIVLVKAEAIDVTPTDKREGLRPIDPRYDLMPGASVPAAAAAFEYHDDWTLTLKATRYEPKEVKATSIERGLLRMVLTRSEVTSVQAIYRVVSARQRLVIRLPDKVEFDTQPLRINGRPVALEKGDQNEYFIPLVGLEQGTPFLMELRYIVSGQGTKLRGPEFPMEPAVQQVFLSVYIPQELAFFGARGPWDEELVWKVKGFNLYPNSQRKPDQLLNWVVHDLKVDRNLLNSFAADGRHLCFTTLRPPADDAGILHLSLVPYWAVSVAVLVIIILIGLTLLSAPLGRRALVVGGWLIVLTAAGVFAPSLVRSLISNAAMAAGIIVLIVWFIWYVLVLLPRTPFADAVRVASDQRKAERAQKPRGAPPPISKAPSAGKKEPKADETKESNEGEGSSHA